jgi:hypothetical protein
MNGVAAVLTTRMSTEPNSTTAVPEVTTDENAVAGV